MKTVSEAGVIAGIQARVHSQVTQGELKPGERVPSIRRQSEALSVSRFAVVEAYDRLVAEGVLEARRGSGFYVAQALRRPALPERVRDELSTASFGLLRLLQAPPGMPVPGSGWLPASWLDTPALRRALRQAAAGAADTLVAYGDPQGDRRLRGQIAMDLSRRGIATDTEGLVLTDGVSQALDLIVTTWLAPGDRVIVEDPGYFNLLGLLRLRGLVPLAVPRGPDGPDLDTLATLMTDHQPRAYFTQSCLHNPTGYHLSPAAVHRILALAERERCLVVDDDIFGAFAATPGLPLAALDSSGLVIHTGGFSKTLSAAMRVGFIRVPAAHLASVIQHRVITRIAGNPVSEAVVATLIAQGQYRHHLARLHERLAKARATVRTQLLQRGFRLEDNDEGLFAWAALPPEALDAQALTDALERQGIVMAPGNGFSPGRRFSRHLRINVAQADDARFWAALDPLLKTTITA